MVARINAAKASQAAVPGLPSLKAELDKNKAPTIVIPEIAFAPDINGVCKVAGTLLINSNPRKIANTKTVILPISAASVRLIEPPPQDEFAFRASRHLCKLELHPYLGYGNHYPLESRPKYHLPSLVLTRHP